MSALIANARRSKKKLYCCFVDFKKAFDSVPRDQLWQVLHSIGLDPSVLSCLQSMYSKDEACVLTQEGLTDAFRCTAGVKQGCPASPLLFGMYIDDIERLLREAEDQIDAPRLLGTLIAILLFADDIALFSYSPRGLQAQLDIMQSFCLARGLKVNVAKTKVVVFEPRSSASPAFTYDGQIIEQVEMFKYLGIAFHGTRGLSCAVDHLCNSARKALFAMRRRCHELGLHQPQQICRLFDALVHPIMCYACEIWGVLGGKSALDNMEKLYTGFLKQLLGVPVTTSTRLVYAEFGRLPIRHFWLQQGLKYMNRLLKMDDTRLCKIAFLADRQGGLGWFAGISDQIRPYGVRQPGTRHNYDHAACTKQIRDREILTAMTAKAGNSLELAYFGHKTEFRCEPYISQAKNCHLRRTLTLFRTGTHWLQVCKGRYLKADFDKRLCRTCRVIDDEAHAVFSCPDYTSQRAKFADLLAGGPCLRSFLVNNPPHRVALFLTECRAVRLSMDKSASAYELNEWSHWPDTVLDKEDGGMPLVLDTFDSDSD